MLAIGEIAGTSYELRLALPTAARQEPPMVGAGAAAGAARTAPRRPSRLLDVLLGQRFDVHVLEGDDAHRGDEASGAIHVPHPGVAELDFEVGRARVLVRGHLHLVREIEA